MHKKILRLIRLAKTDFYINKILVFICAQGNFPRKCIKCQFSSSPLKQQNLCRFFLAKISKPAMLVAKFFGGNQLHKFVPTGFSVIYLLNWSFFLREILSPQFLIAFKFPYWSRILFMYLLSRCLGTYAQGILWNLIPPKNFMDS